MNKVLITCQKKKTVKEISFTSIYRIVHCFFTASNELRNIDKIII